MKGREIQMNKWEDTWCHNSSGSSRGWWWGGGGGEGEIAYQLGMKGLLLDPATATADSEYPTSAQLMNCWKAEKGRFTIEKEEPCWWSYLPGLLAGIAGWVDQVLGEAVRSPITWEERAGWPCCNCWRIMSNSYWWPVGKQRQAGLQMEKDEILLSWSMSIRWHQVVSGAGGSQRSPTWKERPGSTCYSCWLSSFNNCCWQNVQRHTTNVNIIGTRRYWSQTIRLHHVTSGAEGSITLTILGRVLLILILNIN